MIQTPVIVTFANQKGDVGKTTLCVTFANYLVTKGARVVVIDCDFQHSIMKCRKANIRKYGEQEMPYEVWAADMERFSTMATLDMQAAIVTPVFDKVYQSIFDILTDKGKRTQRHTAEQDAGMTLWNTFNQTIPKRTKQKSLSTNLTVTNFIWCVSIYKKRPADLSIVKRLGGFLYCKDI